MKKRSEVIDWQWEKELKLEDVEISFTSESILIRKMLQGSDSVGCSLGLMCESLKGGQ